MFVFECIVHWCTKTFYNERKGNKGLSLLIGEPQQHLLFGYSTLLQAIFKFLLQFVIVSNECRNSVNSIIDESNATNARFNPQIITKSFFFRSQSDIAANNEKQLEVFFFFVFFFCVCVTNYMRYLW